LRRTWRSASVRATDRERETMAKELERPPRGKGRVIAGVCAGLARRYGWSTGVVRLIFVITGLFGAGEIAYLVLWIAMPKARR
jgi:phage shock protein C